MEPPSAPHLVPPRATRGRALVALLVFAGLAGVGAGLLLWWSTPTTSHGDAVRGVAPAAGDIAHGDGGSETSAKPVPPPASRSDDRAPAPRSGTREPESGEGTYVFPVQPPEAASYGRDHHTYPATDMFAACGTQVVAVTDGRVGEVGAIDEWVPEVDDPATRGGMFVSLVGDDGVRYYASHLASLAPGVVGGARLRAGEPIGLVGWSGNARSTPCHVHFGLSPPSGPGDWELRRGTIWPWPYLDAWRDGRHESPGDEVRAWAQAHLDGR